MAIGLALIGSAVIGAGAQLGAAALADDPERGSVFGEATNVDISPGLKIAEFNNLLAQGIFDPTPLLQASPINQLLGEVLSSAIFTEDEKSTAARQLRDVGKLIAERNELQAKIDANEGFDSSRFIVELANISRQAFELIQGRLFDKMLALTGASTFDELFELESSFQEQVKPLLASAQGAAAGNFKAILDTRSRIVNLISDLPDVSAAGIQKLRGEEKTRLLRDLNRDIDEQSSDLLQLANFGNFNPGRPLGDLEEFRSRATQDADLVALDRALAIIGGQQTATKNQLNILSSEENQRFNITSGIAAADQGLRSPGFLQQPTLEPTNALATGLSAAGANLGTGLNNFAQLQLLQGTS